MDAMDKDSFSLMETLGEYYEKNTKKAPHCFSRYELAKSRLVFYKHKALASLPDYLVEFESGLTASGAKVLYAEDASNAVSEVNKLISSKDTVFISNDRLVDEIGLISSLEGKNIKCQNSRISNFPYPILPYSSSFFLQLLAKKLDIDDLESPTRQIISLYKSHLLESSFKDAVHISGADFLIADPASVVMLENDGIRYKGGRTGQEHACAEESLKFQVLVIQELSKKDRKDQHDRHLNDQVQECISDRCQEHLVREHSCVVVKERFIPMHVCTGAGLQ